MRLSADRELAQKQIPLLKNADILEQSRSEAASDTPLPHAPDKT
jgi:hypothetical protein